MKRLILPISFVIIFLVPNLLFTIMKNCARPDAGSDLMPKLNYENTILVEDQGRILQMDLEEYILSVLLAEVPANFECEALKAQAIATRTYTLRRYLLQNKHENAHVCTNATCCQAFIQISDYLEQGHTDAQLRKIKDAVDETARQVITYHSELIEATYFSCAGMRTEKAVDVWGKDVPYLLSVESPGEEISRNYRSTTILSYKKFAEKLDLDETQCISSADLSITYTTGGGIAEMRILGQHFTGTELRSILELPSTVMDFKFEDEFVEITTIGAGHRVGMSQYGAHVMALSGKKAEEILLHYYSGTELQTLSDAQLKGIFDKGRNL